MMRYLGSAGVAPEDVDNAFSLNMIAMGYFDEEDPACRTVIYYSSALESVRDFENLGYKVSLKEFLEKTI